MRGHNLLARERSARIGEMQRAIARELGSQYDLAEPLPEALTALLEQIDAFSGENERPKRKRKWSG
jgi:hypothetical protein